MNKQEKEKLGKLLMADQWAIFLKINATEKAKDMNRHFTKACLQQSKSTWSIFNIILLVIRKRQITRYYSHSLDCLHNKESVCSYEEIRLLFIAGGNLQCFGTQPGISLNDWRKVTL